MKYVNLNLLYLCSREVVYDNHSLYLRDIISVFLSDVVNKVIMSLMSTKAFINRKDCSFKQILYDVSVSIMFL